MRNYFARMAARVGTLLRRAAATVGHVSWQPPGWWRAGASILRAHRWKSALLLGVIVLAVCGGRSAYTHWRRPVPPHLVHGKVLTPEVPALADTLAPSYLRVRFDESAAALDLSNKELSPGLVVLDPPLPGIWRWEGDRTLVFKLAGEWPAAQMLRVTIQPTALSPAIRLASDRLETRTPPFEARFTKAEFYQNPQNLAVRQVTATLLTSHAVDPAELTRHVSVAMLGSSTVFGAPAPKEFFTLTPGRHGREFFFRTVPLTLPPEPDTMKLRVAAGLTAMSGGAALSFDAVDKVVVPDLYSFFHVEGASTRIVKDKAGNPEQLLLVETSCQVRSEDLARSLALYALPADNPARKAERRSAHHDVRDNDHATADTTGADDSTDDDEDRGDEGDRDDDDHAESASEPATAVDAPHPSDAWSASEVDTTALARARHLEATLVPSATETATTHIFRLRDDRPGFLFVRVAKDVPAPGGYKLRGDYTNVVPVPVPGKEIVIQGDGGLLALSGERKLSVLSRGLPAIKFEIARVPAAAINHLVSQTRGDFQNPEFRDGAFNEQDFARFSEETQPISSANPVEANYSTFDFTSHLRPAADQGLDREGLFFLTASGWDPKTNKYVRGVQTTRFVLVTDLGVLVKRNADGSRDVFAASLANGTPFGHAAVSIIARNGVVLADAATDDAGRASLPSLGKNPHDSREPVAVVVRHGGDVAFLPYDRADRRLDFSRFPTEGVESRTGHELDAFVFTERGVYRPGDTFHVGVIVKQRDWNGSLDGIPLETEVVDAREQPAQVKPLTLSASGFVEWAYGTTHDSPTGGYTLNVYLRRNGQRGTLLGSTTVQVKEFLPDRLKLEVTLSRSSGPHNHGWVTPNDLHGGALLKNLYGTTAEDRLVKAHLRLNPRAFAFKEFPDYTFYDRLREHRQDWGGETIELGDQRTAADGTARFDFDLQKFADATYRLTFDAEGFEAEGGRSVEDLTGTLVSPLPFVVGWRADGDLNWITAGGPSRTVQFIGVDRDLNRIPLENLTVHLAEQRWISVLTKDPDGNYRYESVRREFPVRDEPFNTAVSAFVLPNTTPGSFIVVLRDSAAQTVARLEYTVVGQGKVTRSLEKNAELEIHLSKDQYRAGEDIEVSITAPYAGNGLITLERERVYTHKWFKSTGTSTVQTITIPADFDGTGYVNVSFVRALDSKEIFMSPLSYAVAPFTANLEHRRLHVDLQTAEKSKPGEGLTIRYRADRPAKIAVFAVDQGILQVTKFPLPDPLAFQFRKSALTVRTSQIVDLLLPEFSLLRAAQSPGGDGDPGVLNPFRRVTEKPVVYWSGIVDADATERTLTYPVPDYFNGTLTVMAVAVSADALGSAKTSTLCRNAFVLTPGVPTLAAPGDEFEVGLTVANGAVGSGPDARVTVAAEPGPGLQLVRGPTEPLRIPEGHEASTVFRVRALDRLGSAQLGFHATYGPEDTRVHATLSIRPAMPFRTLVTSGHFAGGTRDVPVNGAALYTEYRHLEANVSALPLGLARGLERYLQEYPHGCSEQITSGAFARLALAGIADFGLTRAEAAAQIEHTIEIDRRRQNDTGGFGFWDASRTQAIDFVTVYVMHFLSEAKAEGYPVPDDMFQKGLEALRRASTASPWSLQQARVQAYALYVLTCEGVVATNQLLTLRDYLDTYYKPRWPGDLTAVYLAGCWSLLKKDDEARRLLEGYQTGRFDLHECWDFYGPLTADAQYITVLARHFPDRLRRVTARELSHVTAPIGDGDFSTLSAAYSVLALKAYSQAIAQNPPHLSVAALLPPKAQEKPLTLDGTANTLFRGTFPPIASALRFRADGGPGAGPGIFYQTIQSGFEHTLPAAAVARGIEVRRDLLDADGKRPITRVKLGERVTVRLRLRAIRPEPVTNVALIDLLPGGFEVADDSLPPGVDTAGMDYVDVREDRAVFYGTVDNRVHEINYRIKPTARGEFTIPPVFAESMYDKKIQSVGVGGKIEVIDSK